jgi:hypothetical protein
LQAYPDEHEFMAQPVSQNQWSAERSRDALHSLSNKNTQPHPSGVPMISSRRNIFRQ